MNILESLWVLIGLFIILLILLTDPKSASRGLGSNELTVLFSSATEGQIFTMLPLPNFSRFVQRRCWQWSTVTKVSDIIPICEKLHRLCHA